MINSNKIRFVLVNTTHPGNIGACARAIKNMGLTQLYLVSPLNYPHSEAIARASGADDVLQNAVIVSSLKEAVIDCNLIVGTSSRERALPIPLLSPRDFALTTPGHLQQGDSIAILFGQERMGLTNDELAICHYHLYIPCNDEYPSLNLAAAVQIIAYELHLILQASTKISKQEPVRVTADDMEKFYTHLEETLIAIEFLDPNNPRQMMRKLRRVFNRAVLEQNEMNILRGILSMVNKKLT